MTIKIPDRLASRKFWVMVVAVIMVLGPEYGLDIEGTIRAIIAATMPAYVIMQALEDALTGKGPATINTTVLQPSMAPPSDHL